MSTNHLVTQAKNRKMRKKREPEKVENLDKDEEDRKELLNDIGDERGTRGPKIVESDLNKYTTFSFSDWKEILKYEKKQNVSHSTLLNSLRKGIPNELRPRIWAFLSEIKDLMDEFVSLFL